MNDENGKMTFLQHLEEMRSRLIKSILSILVGIIICWFFRESIREFLEAPLYEAWASVEGLPEPKPLSFTSLLEPFVAYLKMSAIGGLFVASPVVLYQLWQFIAPGLYARERKLALPFVFASTLLFVGGSTMAYKLVFPIGFAFFLDFAAGGTVDMVSLEVDVAGVYDVAKGKIKADVNDNTDEQSSKTLNDKRTDVVIDAGVEADAGVSDGGLVKKEILEREMVARGPPKSSITDKEQPAENTAIKSADVFAAKDSKSNALSVKEKKAWFEHLFEKLFRENCGMFTAVPDSGTVMLSYKWHTRRCGETPELAALLRGEDELNAKWIEDKDREEEFTYYSFVDEPPKDGHYIYELKTVTAQEGAGKLAPMLMVKDYLSIAIRLLLAFGIIFELPILILFLALAGIVNYRQLLQFSRWFVVLSIVLAAMLTPPDVITQLLLAAPLIFLYFVSVLIAYIFGRKREKQE